MSDSPRGLARHSDPQTSHEAHRPGAASDAPRWEILTVLSDLPVGVWDEEIATYLTEGFMPSGAKTRRKELVHLGLVEPVGTSIKERSRRVRLWAPTDVGRQLASRGERYRLRQMYRRHRTSGRVVHERLRHIATATGAMRLREIGQAILSASEAGDERGLQAAIGRLCTALDQ